MENSNLKRYLTLIWQRLTQPLPKWMHYLLFLLVFTLFLHYQNPALWNALAGAPSALWEFLFSPSSILNLPWYVLVPYLIVYIIFMFLLWLYLDLKIDSGYECNICHAKFVRRFMFRERLPEDNDNKGRLFFLETLELILFLLLIGIIFFYIRSVQDPESKWYPICPQCGAKNSRRLDKCE
jgi:hypothetical protein